jgi:hypothetical protein
MLGVVFIVDGADQPCPDGRRFRFEGDLTVLADGRVALLTPDEEAHDLGALLAALVGEEPDALGDRHVGRVRLTVEGEDRHERLNNAGYAALAWPSSERPAVG